jgi:Mobilization protein NikA
MARRRFFRGSTQIRKYIYAPVSDEEHALITQRAKAAHLSVAEWMRRAVNRQLFDADENSPLLVEHGEGWVRGERREEHR